MPPPTILKRRHTLKGQNAILKVMKKFKEIRTTQRTEWARLKSNEKIEDLAVDDLKEKFKALTGDDAAQVLEITGAAGNEENLRKLLHVAILLANEIGQPTGSDLHANEDTDEEEVDTAGPSCKKRKTDNQSIMQRIANLEKTKGDSIKDLKEKVRSLALQSNPNDALILLNLVELARKARKVDDPDADIFEELWRQANRHQGSVNLASLTLSVIGGKASDIVVKAMAKCLKERQVDEKISTATSSSNKANDTVSPLANAYPTQMMPQYIVPQIPAGWQQTGAFPFSNAYQIRRPFGPRMNQWRPRGNCYFCNSPDHSVKDCEKMKTAKNK